MLEETEKQLVSVWANNAHKYIDWFNFIFILFKLWLNCHVELTLKTPTGQNLTNSAISFTNCTAWELLMIKKWIRKETQTMSLGKLEKKLQLRNRNWTVWSSWRIYISGLLLNLALVLNDERWRGHRKKGRKTNEAQVQEQVELTREFYRVKNQLTIADDSNRCSTVGWLVRWRQNASIVYYNRIVWASIAHLTVFKFLKECIYVNS